MRVFENPSAGQFGLPPEKRSASASLNGSAPRSKGRGLSSLLAPGLRGPEDCDGTASGWVDVMAFSPASFFSPRSNLSATNPGRTGRSRPYSSSDPHHALTLDGRNSPIR